MTSPEEHLIRPDDPDAALAVAGLLLADAADTSLAAESRARFLEALAAEAEDTFHKPPLEPSPEVLSDVVVRLRCTYCHETLEISLAAYCAACLAPHHAGCHADHGQCAAPGCGEVRLVRPQDNEPPRRRAWFVAAFVVGAVAAAALVPDVAPLVHPVDGPSGVERRVQAPPPALDIDATDPRDVPPVVAPKPNFDGRSILFVTGARGPEARYVEGVLSDQGHVIFESCDTKSRALPPPSELPRYDLIILGDVDVKRPPFSTKWLKALAEAVDVYGVSLLLISGVQNPVSMLGTPLERVLPIVIDQPSMADGRGWKPSPTEEGIRTLRLGATEAETRALWKTVPPLYWRAGASRGRPGAHVLAHHVSEQGSQPVVAWQQVGRGRCFWLGFQELWAWRSHHEVAERFLIEVVDFCTAPVPGVTAAIEFRDRSLLDAVVGSTRRREGELQVQLSREWVKVSKLSRIRFSGAPQAEPGWSTVMLRDGSVLRGRIDWDRSGMPQGMGYDPRWVKLVVKGRPGLLELPVDRLRAVILPVPDGMRAELLLSLKDETRGHMVYKNGDRVYGKVRLDRPNVATVIKPDPKPFGVSQSASVQVLQMIDFGGAGVPGGSGLRVELVDGSSLRCKLLEMNATRLRLEWEQRRLDISRDDVRAFRFE